MLVYLCWNMAFLCSIRFGRNFKLQGQFCLENRELLHVYILVDSGSGVSTNTSPGSNTSLVCSEGFYVSLEDISNGTTEEVCRPECGEWEEFPHSTVVALYVTQTVAGVTYMIGGVVVLVLSVMRYKQM